MLTEAALSFLSIGVQPPDASWGTIILDGQGLLYTRPAVALAPGHRDRPHRARAQRPRRRRPRRARPAGEAPRGRPDAALRRPAARVDGASCSSRSACSCSSSSSPRPASTRPRGSPGATPTRRRCAAVRKDFGLDRPMPVQYALMMKKLFVTRDLTSFVNRGAKVIPQVRGGGARDALARHRRRGGLDGLQHPDGHRSPPSSAARRSTRC